MTESAAPLLLARDREQLDRVVRSIRDERRGFFVIVCAPELRPAAVRYLAETSGKGIAEPGLVSGHDEMVERMGVLDGKPAGSVEGFRIDAADVDVFTALNWHREKVRRAGQVILWLDSVEGLEELQRHAPDAYSFREGVLVLAGEGVPNTEWEAEEPPDVKTARLLYELPRPPEERAEAAVELAALLHARERVNEPLAVISEGLGLIPGAQYATQTHRMTRARLLEVLGLIANSRGCRIDAFRAYQRALQELGSDLSSRGARFHVSLALASSALSPLGANAAILKESVEWLATETDPAAVFLVHHWVADSARHRGAFELAVAHHTLGLATPGVRSADKVHTLLMRCDTLREMGRFREADEDVSAADAASLRAGIARAWAQTYRAGLLRDKGEVAAAASIAQHVAESPESAAMAPPWCNFFAVRWGLTPGPCTPLRSSFANRSPISAIGWRSMLAAGCCVSSAKPPMRPRLPKKTSLAPSTSSTPLVAP